MFTVLFVSQTRRRVPKKLRIRTLPQLSDAIQWRILTARCLLPGEGSAETIIELALPTDYASNLRPIGNVRNAL